MEKHVNCLKRMGGKTLSQKAKIVLVLIVVLIAGYILFKPMFDQQQVPLHKQITDYQGVFEAATKEGRPIFLEFYSET